MRPEPGAPARGGAKRAAATVPGEQPAARRQRAGRAPPHLDLPTPLSPMMRIFRVVSTSSSILRPLDSDPAPGPVCVPPGRRRRPAHAHLQGLPLPQDVWASGGHRSSGSAQRRLCVCALPGAQAFFRVAPEWCRGRWTGMRVNPPTSFRALAPPQP